MIRIITDSSSNITQEEAKTLGVTVMPLTIMFGTEEYRDGVDITFEEFYEKMAASKEFPHTSQLTEKQVEDAVNAVLETADAGDEILIMPIALALSGSYLQCKKVAERYKNVYAYETKCTTVMLKLMIWEALQNKQKSAQEVMRILDELRPKLKIYAVLDTLENLGKGGRLPKAVALIGSVLKIKPVITFSLDGKVELVSKQFGINKGIAYINSVIRKENIDYSKPVYLIYTGDDKNSETLIQKLGIKYSEKSNICPVIGAHNGANAAGIVYAEK